MKNVVVDFGKYYLDEALMGTVMSKYAETKHRDEAYVHWTPGFIRGNCKKKEEKWEKKAFPGWGEDMVYRGFMADPTVDISPSSPVCDVWEDHPVIMIQRDTFANFFHDSEDFFNLFLALLILKWEIGDSQVFLVDLYPKGPFWAVWEKVFGKGRPPLLAWDIREKYGDKKVCFKNIAMGIYGPAATITLAGFNTPCSHGAVVRAYSDVFLRGLNLHSAALRATPASQDPKKVVVTWMARRPSVNWPEKNFCDDSTFFKCHYFQRLGVRQLQRQVKNEAEVTAKLKELERETYRNGAVVEVRIQDYNLLTFEQQLANDVETDIMVGPHGAGLQHSLYMRDRGVLIELFIDGTSGRRHFHNMAKWHGRKYIGPTTPNPVKAEQLKNDVKGAIEGLDLSAY
mmetsp:Transcript_5557/g.15531  ORF Transcript_5557/g.15531 Transcript_5557/m.15531 type:complete len:399 (-) Transcript_5557:538-1734(-)